MISDLILFDYTTIDKVMKTQFWRDNVDPAVEPARVLIERGEWIDAERDSRPVKYKIYYPNIESDHPLPTIIWSHGLGGTQDGAGFIARFLASHGFIHVNIGHEGTNDSLWRGKPGHPWDNIRKAKIPWEDVQNRYLDVPYALNMMGQTDLPVSVDFDRLGMSGHSFGALTTQIIAGQLTGNPDPEDFSVDQFKCALAYSPVPNIRIPRPAEEVYSPISLPIMHMSGAEDHSPLDGNIQAGRDEIFHYAGQNDVTQVSVILDMADHMVFNGSRGQLPGYDGMDLNKDQIKILALAWFDWMLRDDAKSGQWMRQDMQDYLGVSSIVKWKNND
jgi:dienelactone hydrolase